MGGGLMGGGRISLPTHDHLEFFGFLVFCTQVKIYDRWTIANQRFDSHRGQALQLARCGHTQR
jgi:hypothetical protein